MWKNAAKLLQGAKQPVITAHVHPDGDALGAEVGLAETLRALGLKPTIINSDPIPANYHFLCRKREPLTFDPTYHLRTLKKADLAILLDANSWDRAGSVGEAISKLSIPTLCIDHHQPREKNVATVWINKTTASSASELIYDFAEYLKTKQTKRFREAIYSGILFDTGNFRFSNTNPRVHEICARLIKEGISVETMYERLFENGNWSRMRLFSMAIQTLRSECNGQLAWFTVSAEMFKKSKATPEEVDGFVDWIRTIQDTKLILMFRDYQDGLVKGSLRSKTDKVDVEKLARQFGGGGHKRASGLTMKGPLDKAAKRVVRVAKKLFSEDK